MNSTQWILFILIVQIIHFLGTWKLYVKAGRKGWEASVPIYNAIVLMQIINRPKWWTFLLFIPIINLLMFPVIWVETMRSFGKNSLLDTWLVILSLGFYIYYMSYTQDVKYVENRSRHPKTALGEWVSSIVFAIVAATLVHTYFIQPYVIPTGSLEKILKTKSYLSKPQLPYFRLPGFQKVKRNDIVVFSWPADTVRQFFKKEKGVRKPIDKKSNYVKRCVGTPGDSLSIINGDVYINGNKLVLSDRAKPMFLHVVSTKGQIGNAAINLLGRNNFGGNVIKIPNEVLTQDKVDEVIDQKTTLEEFERDSLYTYYTGYIADGKVVSFLKATSENSKALFNMTEEEAKNDLGKAGIVSIKKFSFTKPETNIFPQSGQYPGTQDNLGPIYLPKAGETISLNVKVLPLYKKIIKEYEGNTLSVSGNQISINGQVTNTYTFKQGYYWMMGDNRHKSEDSRFWGYVPENHIVGKPVFIWMSIDGINDGLSNWKVRWDRVFTTVGGDGEPQSYFKYFLIALAGWFVFDYFRKKKKKK
jgi:signal peptidase I